MINIVAIGRAAALVAAPLAFAAIAAPAHAQDGYGRLLSPQSRYGSAEFAPGPSGGRPRIYGYRSTGPYARAAYRPRVYGYRPGSYAYYGTGAWWRAMVMENRGGNVNN